MPAQHIFVLQQHQLEHCHGRGIRLDCWTAPQYPITDTHRCVCHITAPAPHSLTSNMRTPRRFKALQPRVRGCIFDSCPAFMHKHAGARALAEGFSPALRPLVKALFYVLVRLSVALQGDYAAEFW